MTERPPIEPSLELRNSYVACIRVLEKDRDEINRAIAHLKEKLAEHERVHGFDAHGEQVTKEG